eukprot:1160084-Pelagomonas_calceolata.AAC.7
MEGRSGDRPGNTMSPRRTHLPARATPEPQATPAILDCYVKELYLHGRYRCGRQLDQNKCNRETQQSM